ncbi:MAG TPA: hypothetical protein VFV99_13865 [Kofleriaceae bacterium]|nr:hypothetical protein [Kofleriaceae bacterium]
MKTFLAIATTIGVFSAPAVAGNNKKNHRDTKPTLVAEKTHAPKADTKPDAKLDAKLDATKPIADAVAAPATASAAAMPGSLGAAAMPGSLGAALATGPALPLPEVLDIPVLPADTSSVLAPYADLERRPLVTAKPLAKAAAKPKAPTLNMGKDYVLGGRQATKVSERDTEVFVPKSLSQAQVATVVQAHMGDIHNCWELLPKAHRADACTAELRLSISDAGVVTDIELGGDVPAGAHKCITSAVSKWTFPTAETRTEIEYGISLRSL